MINWRYSWPETSQNKESSDYSSNVLLQHSVWTVDAATLPPTLNLPSAATPPLLRGGHSIYVSAINTGRNKVVIMLEGWGTHWLGRVGMHSGYYAVNPSKF
jgi:hypothetical protein